MQEFTGKEYLRIDIANAFGLDKKNWDERLAWFHDQVHTFDLAEADDKYLAAKAIQAYEDACNGIPTGHVMYLDACSSGLQIMACLMGCETTARQCGLIFTGKREDAYSNATESMNQYVAVDVPRSVMKYPVMTTMYGSTAQPIEVFGEGTEELHAFYQALKERFPGALEYLEDSQSCWQSGVFFHKWTMPDGTMVKVKVWDEVEKKIEIDELGCSFTHKGRINTPTHTGISLAANIVQSIDAWIDSEMSRRAHAQGFDMLSNMDAFGASPNHMNKVRQNYLDIMIKIASQDILGSILSEITGMDLAIQKSSNNLPELMKTAEYPLS